MPVYVIAEESCNCYIIVDTAYRSSNVSAIGECRASETELTVTKIS